MPRIRSIKPEFFDSPGTQKASPLARLLFIAMWCWADDWGVGEANPRRLLGFAFPYDDDERVIPRNFPGIAGEVAECYGVTWYEADGREWFAIPSWEKHQRTDKRSTKRAPGPDQAERIMYAQEREIPPHPPESPGIIQSGTGEQGNRGTGEQTSSSEVADATPRPDVEELLDYLDAQIREYDPEARAPSRTKGNRDAARLLLDKDGRTVEQVKAAIAWSQNDEFWRPNIRSMSKLREKYDQLRARAQQSRAPAAPPKKDGRGNNQWMY